VDRPHPPFLLFFQSPPSSSSGMLMEGFLRETTRVLRSPVLFPLRSSIFFSKWRTTFLLFFFRVSENSDLLFFATDLKSMVTSPRGLLLFFPWLPQTRFAPPLLGTTSPDAFFLSPIFYNQCKSLSSMDDSSFLQVNRIKLRCVFFPLIEMKTKRFFSCFGRFMGRPSSFFFLIVLRLPLFGECTWSFPPLFFSSPWTTNGRPHSP